MLQQAADDLDALTLADGKVSDMREGIEWQAILDRQFARLLGDFEDRRLLVERKHDVFSRGQRVEEREMLEDHADAEGACRARAGDGHGSPFPVDFAGGGFERTEQHLHERRFAGTIFAEKCVYLALADLEVDGVARLQRTEYLRKPADVEELAPGIKSCVHNSSHCHVMFPSSS